MTLATYSSFEGYKPTGIDWQSHTPQHWDVKPIMAVARVISENNQPGLELLSVYLGQGVVRFSDVDEKRTNATSVDLSKYQIVRPGNLVLNNQQAWRGSVGVARNTGIVSPAYIVLDLGENFDPVFADYYYRTSTTVSHFLVSSKGVGTIQRNLYWSALRRCPVTIPPRPEQRVIAAFLDEKCAKLDEAVRIKQEQIALLRERRQILIQQAVTRGLNPEAPMKDSGVEWIGEIPAHWEVKRNKHMFVEVNERSAKGTEQHLSMSQKLGLVPADLVEKSLVSESYEGAKLVQPGDLVLNRLKAHLAVFSLAPMEGLVSPDYSVFRPFITGASSRYFEALFKTSVYLGEFRLRVRGIVEGFFRLYTDSFMDVPLVIPPQHEQSEITDHLEKMSVQFEDAIAMKEQQIAALKEYRTNLVDAAVTGKIKLA
ncbi:restriction endonuclease subunit S [Rhizobium leguminosarum]|uniref:restriction endonuclease subunit S n=1 Tax=Rhizobium leguminosarum TaxID=384 RepID=UPI00103DB9A6|nr:restriction endonuclease subunit S [Rhizobium leguminosarum]TBZ72473.1 restriction endonuclease subunit S [Rhizobium leguminosarum bv. viciae]